MHRVITGKAKEIGRETALCLWRHYLGHVLSGVQIVDSDFSQDRPKGYLIPLARKQTSVVL